MDNYEVSFMVWLQSKRTKVTDSIAVFFHYLLKEEIVFFSCPILIWIWSVPFGTSDMVLACTTEVVNGILKWIFQQPRPFWIHPEIKNLRGAFERDYSTPSSHSQIIASLATYSLWNLWNVPWVTVLGVAITLCVGLSRVYLGVHFPHDIIFGWSVGITLGALFGIYEPVHWLRHQSLSVALPISFLVPMVLFIILYLEWKFIPGRAPELIEEWEQQARSALPEGKQPTEKERLHPRDISKYTFQLAFIFGSLLSMSVIRYMPEHDTITKDCMDTSRIWIYLIRILMGLAGLALLFGLKEMVKKKNSRIENKQEDIELKRASENSRLLPESGDLKRLPNAGTVIRVGFYFVVDVSSVFFGVLLLPWIFQKASLGCA